MSSNGKDQEMICRAMAGDKSALEALLYGNSARLHAYLRRHFPQELKGVLEPQDILQDTWLRAVRSIGSFTPKGHDALYRWLVTIARHLITDQVRHQNTKKLRIKSDVANGDRDDGLMSRLLEELAIYERTPSRSAASHELMLAVQIALGNLPQEQAQALRLRHLDGLSPQEVASQMKRSVGSVSMLCNRGLKSLRWEMRSISLYI